VRLAAGPPNATIPSSSDDLSAIATAAQKAAAAAQLCGSAVCPKVDCPKAQDLSDALDDARAVLRPMQVALASDASDEQTHFQSLQAEYVRNVSDDVAVQRALSRSKALLNFGKLMLDASSLIDGWQSIGEMKNLIAGARCPVLWIARSSRRRALMPWSNSATERSPPRTILQRRQAGSRWTR